MTRIVRDKDNYWQRSEPMARGRSSFRLAVCFASESIPRKTCLHDPWSLILERFQGARKQMENWPLHVQLPNGFFILIRRTCAVCTLVLTSFANIFHLLVVAESICTCFYFSMKCFLFLSVSTFWFPIFVASNFCKFVRSNCTYIYI